MHLAIVAVLSPNDAVRLWNTSSALGNLKIRIHAPVIGKKHALEQRANANIVEPLVAFRCRLKETALLTKQVVNPSLEIRARVPIDEVDNVFAVQG